MQQNVRQTMDRSASRGSRTLVALALLGTALFLGGLTPGASSALADTPAQTPGSGSLRASRIGDEAPKEEEKEKKYVDPADVYYGDSREWSKPAEVDAAAVYAEIEEYKQIQDEKLETSDARYGVLMSKANKKFKCAVRKAAKDGDYDLVAKVGSVKGAGTVPVITSKVIGKL